MKALTAQLMPDFFASLASAFELRLPILLPDGTRTIGAPADGPLALMGGAVPAKPTAAFFPQQGELFSVSAGVSTAAPVAPLPLLVVGFTPRDLACLRFIDRFFGEGWRDDLYFRQRQGAIVAGVSGYCGAGGALLPLAGGDCDLEFAWDGGRWLVPSYTESGSRIAAGIAGEVAAEALEPLRRASLEFSDQNEGIIQRASQLLRSELVPDSFWSEIGDRCIACTGCNLTCPTCTCFGVRDWRFAGRVERSRMWDSCQLDGFMREAGGHNPLGSEALRSRRRIHHKLAADPERWGEISCFLCGRCDAACPTGIGMMAVAREMVGRFGEEKG